MAARQLQRAYQSIRSVTFAEECEHNAGDDQQAGHDEEHDLPLGAGAAVANEQRDEMRTGDAC